MPQTWWVVYSQDLRRSITGKASVGSGARYALQTFYGTEKMVRHQFSLSLAQMFEERRPALDFLQEINIVDEVMNS